MKWYIIGGAISCAAIFAAFSLKLKLQTCEMKSEKLKGSLRIVQLSDLHDCVFGKKQSKLIKMVKDASPDVILFTGDNVQDSTKYVKSLPMLTEDHPARVLFEQLGKIAPMYMVLGNHEARIDDVNTLRKELSELNIKLIGGCKEKVKLNESTVELIGIDDPRFYSKEKRPTKLSEIIKDEKQRMSPSLIEWRSKLSSLEPTERDVFSILLSHRPEEYEHYKAFDLVFSGHAHGGQFRLPPFINGLYAPHQGFFPEHAGGVYYLGGEGSGAVHIVSRGLSKTRFPRLFNRPEVWLIKVN